MSTDKQPAASEPQAEKHPNKRTRSNYTDASSDDIAQAVIDYLQDECNGVCSVSSLCKALKITLKTLKRASSSDLAADLLCYTMSEAGGFTGNSMHMLALSSVNKQSTMHLYSSFKDSRKKLMKQEGERLGMYLRADAFATKCNMPFQLFKQIMMRSRKEFQSSFLFFEESDTVISTAQYIVDLALSILKITTDSNAPIYTQDEDDEGDDDYDDVKAKICGMHNGMPCVRVQLVENMLELTGSVMIRVATVLKMLCNTSVGWQLVTHQEDKKSVIDDIVIWKKKKEHITSLAQLKKFVYNHCEKGVSHYDLCTYNKTGLTLLQIMEHIEKNDEALIIDKPGEDKIIIHTPYVENAKSMVGHIVGAFSALDLDKCRKTANVAPIMMTK